jgi:hypothetical protein
MLAEKSMLHSQSTEEQLSYAFRQIASRPIRPQDLAILMRAYDKQKGLFANDLPAAQAFIATGNASRDASLDPVSHAALSAVCLSIFNLDESLSRE